MKTRIQAIIDKICGIPIAGLPGAGHGAQPGHGSEMAQNVFILIRFYTLIGHNCYYNEEDVMLLQLVLLLEMTLGLKNNWRPFLWAL